MIPWYRPPTSAVDNSSFESLREVLIGQDSQDREITLLCDINCDLKTSKINPNTKKLRQLYSAYQVEQIITEYTRVAVTSKETGELSTSKSLIDHFPTNRPQHILKSGVLEIGMADHYTSYAVRKVNASRFKRNSPKMIEFCALRNYCKDDLIKDLQHINWVSTLEPMSDSPNGVASVFIDIFKKILKVHASLNKRKVRREYAPWLTSGIKKSKEEHDKMKKLASKDPKLWPKYKTLRYRVTNKYHKEIRKYYKDLVTKSKSNITWIWKAIEKILHKTSGTTANSELRDEDVTCKKTNDDLIKYLNSVDFNHNFSFK